MVRTDVLDRGVPWVRSARPAAACAGRAQPRLAASSRHGALDRRRRRCGHPPACCRRGLARGARGAESIVLRPARAPTRYDAGGPPALASTSSITLQGGGGADRRGGAPPLRRPSRVSFPGFLLLAPAAACLLSWLGVGAAIRGGSSPERRSSTRSRESGRARRCSRSSSSASAGWACSTTGRWSESRLRSRFPAPGWR